ncbi:FAD-dependent oxidoreductase [Amycolatopsis sp. La24]|uniref:FAD-dependent oxidoreductase n=1 Tax=Amycolatopsis sp. La24 TaxID=3028304 RepID=UPI0023B133A5|nr:FAD-dependent oxidoreductase [Amycolatopsis sp. La24]
MREADESYDVVVCGGGLAGFSAAVAAARHGASVCLLQNRPVLGGNSSSEIRVTPHGAAAFHAYARETGIVAEALIEERATNHEQIAENGWTNSQWDLVLYDVAMRTPNLTLHLNTSVHDVRTAGGRITTVFARVDNAETLLRVHGQTFIDCTGDATVAALAGAGYRSGVEAHDEFGEPHAPLQAGPEVMGSSLHFKTVDVGRPVEFHAPDWAVRYDDPDFFYRGGRMPSTLRCGYWWIEIGPPWDTIHDNEAIRHELTRHVLGIWDYLKNRDPRFKNEARNLALDWVGQVPGKRESRRVDGLHLITENELVDRRQFPDEIAFGGWYIDLHTLGGLLADTSEPLNAQGLDPTSEYGAKTNVGPFGIPLRSLISADISNLLLAGRNISGTHAAMGSIRVMSTCAVIGQAAGTAAALALTRNETLASGVSGEAVHVLQQTLLRDGCFLPNERGDDPADLARLASASASSEDSLRGVGIGSVGKLADLDHWRDHPVYPYRGRLDRRVAQWIALDERRQIDTIGCCLSNEAEEAVPVEARLYAVRDIWDYDTEPGAPAAKTTLSVSPGGPRWVDWPVALDLRDAMPDGADFVRVDLAPAPSVEWHVADALQPGNLAAYEAMPGTYRRFGGGATMSFRISPEQSVYGPGQSLTGVTRPHRQTNLWRSDPREPLPQWLDLAWDTAVELRQVQLTFAGHVLREYHAYPPFYRDPQCVRDYTLSVQAADGDWVELVRVKDNYTTRVVHELDEAVSTDRLRLTVTATNGDPAAALYEIRCYSGTPCVAPSFNPVHS